MLFLVKNIFLRAHLIMCGNTAIRILKEKTNDNRLSKSLFIHKTYNYIYQCGKGNALITSFGHIVYPEPKLLQSLLSIYNIQRNPLTKLSLITGGNQWHFTQLIIIREMFRSNTIPNQSSISNYKNKGLHQGILLVKLKSVL